MYKYSVNSLFLSLCKLYTCSKYSIRNSEPKSLFNINMKQQQHHNDYRRSKRKKNNLQTKMLY